MVYHRVSLGCLREIPVSGQTWTSARRANFLQAFTAVLDFSVIVDDSPPPTSDGWQLDDDDEQREDDDA